MEYGTLNRPRARERPGGSVAFTRPGWSCASARRAYHWTDADELARAGAALGWAWLFAVAEPLVAAPPRPRELGARDVLNARRDRAAAFDDGTVRGEPTLYLLVTPFNLQSATTTPTRARRE